MTSLAWDTAHTGHEVLCVCVYCWVGLSEMPSNCAVYGCDNSKKNKGGKAFRYFSFPKDPTVREVWVQRCCRSDVINTKYAIICSAHFTEEDYIDDMKSRLLNIDSPYNKRLLKKEAVPSLFLYKGKLLYIAEYTIFHVPT